MAVPVVERLWTRSFCGLLVTQFLGAMNDNIFRWLIVPVGKEWVGPEYEQFPLTLGVVAFVLPFILFAAPAGFLADRFRKRSVIVGCKVAEVVLMIAGIAAILSGSLTLMFVLLFLMGIHSAVFSPSKYGSIPELVPGSRIAAANGMVGMTTIIAIVFGTVLGGYLYAWTSPLGQHNWWLSATVLVGIAGLGLATSLLIHPVAAASPARPVPWQTGSGRAIDATLLPLRILSGVAMQTGRDLAMLGLRRPLLLAALGSALFWSLGSLVQINVDYFATRGLGVVQQHVGPLLAMLALGVGVGNVLGGLCSRGRIELRIVPIGAFGIAASGLLLASVPGADGNPLSVGYFLAALWLFVLGAAAGMYDIPLQSYLQYHSPVESRGAILAAANFITYVGMVLASVVFYALRGGLGVSGKGIFLVAGLAMLPIAAVLAWRLFRRPSTLVTGPREMSA